jgi:hypothetical protein
MAKEKKVEVKNEEIETENQLIIESWFRELLHNSRVSQNTDIYNEVRNAVNILKNRVK